jgi:hypothetical protein
MSPEMAKEEGGLRKRSSFDEKERDEGRDREKDGLTRQKGEKGVSGTTVERRERWLRGNTTWRWG